MTSPADRTLASNDAQELSDLGRRISGDRNRVWILTGPRASGKTTLLVETWRRFLDGPFADFAFAGSETMLGFERRAFLSRTTSGQTVTDTERTSEALGEATAFLHLRLRSQLTQEVVGVLASDWPGETFRRLRDNAIKEESVATTLPGLDIGTRVAVVVNGRELADASARHAARASTEMIISALSTSNPVRKDASVALVVAKWDRVNLGGEKAVQFADSLIQDLLDRHSRAFHELVAIKTAARSDDPTVERGFGLDRLLQWATTSPVERGYTRSHSTGREFQNFVGAGNELRTLLASRGTP